MNTSRRPVMARLIRQVSPVMRLAVMGAGLCGTIAVLSPTGANAPLHGANPPRAADAGALEVTRDNPHLGFAIAQQGNAALRSIRGDWRESMTGPILPPPTEIAQSTR